MLTVIEFQDGSTKNVTGETGRYFVCEDAMYKKTSPLIKRIRRAEEKKKPEKKKKSESRSDV